MLSFEKKTINRQIGTDVLHSSTYLHSISIAWRFNCIFNFPKQSRDSSQFFFSSLKNTFSLFYCRHQYKHDKQSKVDLAFDYYFF